MNEKFFERCDLELVNSTPPFTKDASTGESASHFVRLCSFAPKSQPCPQVLLVFQYGGGQGCLLRQTAANRAYMFS